MKAISVFIGLALIAGGCGNKSSDASPQTLNPNTIEHFPMADADGDGALSVDEFKTFVALEAEDGVGKSSLVKQFGAYDRAFKALDANKDGTVTLDEIETFQISQ